MERKKKKRKKREKYEVKAHSQSHDTSHCQLINQMVTLYMYLEQLLRNLLRTNTVVNAWRKRKVDKYRETTGQSRFSIPQYNLLSFCILNIYFLSYIVVDILLTKKLERKEKEQMQGQIHRTFYLTWLGRYL